MLLASALVEFVTLRVFARVGSIPQVPWILSAYQLMLTIGSIALSVAFALSILLALILVQSLRGRTRKDRFLGLSILTLVIAALATLIEAPSPFFSIAYSILAVLVLVSLIARLSIRDGVRGVRLLQGFATLATLSIFYFKLIPQLEYLAGTNLSFARPLEVFLVGEASSLLAAITTSALFLFHRNKMVSRRAVAWAGLVTGVFVGLYLTSSWLVSIIVMWTLGYTLFLPFAIYAIALFLFTYTIASSPRKERWISMGLLLLLLAGRLAQLGYHTLVMMIGIALLSLPEAFGFSSN